ncbi:hypothetical protein HYR69_11530 [Candidatus Sumerlaeota bacterium]|nr:hypothetical protein [Candidatus Sumerlaeota bacterium]
MNVPPEDGNPDDANPHEEATAIQTERPRVNRPADRPAPGSPLPPDEPPPLPPNSLLAWVQGTIGLFGGPRRLPFWWHLNTGALEVAHWSRSYRDFQTSTEDFYNRMEKVFKAEQIRQLKLSRVLWKEAGLLSADRLYLRVAWNRYVGDMCAAPLGQSFFFSFWVFVLPPILSLFHIAGMMTTFVTVGILMASDTHTPLSDVIPICFFPLVPLLSLWVRFSRQAVNDGVWSDFLLGLTILGPVIDILFRPLTYFQRDTAGMFLGMIQQIFFENVDEVTQAEGQRPLTDLEKKPDLASFMSLKPKRGRPA